MDAYIGLFDRPGPINGGAVSTEGTFYVIAIGRAGNMESIIEKEPAGKRLAVDSYGRLDRNQWKTFTVS